MQQEKEAGEGAVGTIYRQLADTFFPAVFRWRLTWSQTATSKHLDHLQIQGIECSLKDTDRRL